MQTHEHVYMPHTSVDTMGLVTRAHFFFIVTMVKMRVGCKEMVGGNYEHLK